MTDDSADRDPLFRARASRERIRRFAVLLDSAIAIPGTRWRIGAESIIGLVPIAGDLAGVVLGSYFLFEGVRAGAPPALLLRMLGNILLDALAGFVPVVGDLIDFAFKSNLRNARLLEAHLDRVLGAPPQSPWPRRLLLLGVLALALAAGYGAWRLLR